MLSLYLLFFYSLLLREGQTREVVWPPRHKIIVEGDPCADDEDSETTSSIRFVSEEAEASSSSQPQGGASSSSSTPMDRAEQFKELANFLAFEDNLDEAVRCYTKAIKINSSVPKYYRNRGFCLKRQEKIDLAIDDYKIALEMEPDSVRGLVYMGRALLSKEKFEEAMMHAEQALIYGEQQELIDQVMYQVTNLQDKIRSKLKERERARQTELYKFLNELIVKDVQRKTDSAPDDIVETIKSDHDEYLKELKAAFPGVDEEQQALSFDHEYLRDKINYELMKDPVITPSGITYERTQIMKYLEEHSNDPISRAPLEPSQLIPNNLLREAIDDYMKTKGLSYD